MDEHKEETLEEMQERFFPKRKKSLSEKIREHFHVYGWLYYIGIILFLSFSNVIAQNYQGY